MSNIIALPSSKRMDALWEDFQRSLDHARNTGAIRDMQAAVKAWEAVVVVLLPDPKSREGIV